MSNPAVRNLARAFGATILVDQTGVKGSLRREATEAGVPTILFEAGETGRFSRKISMIGLRGVMSVLAEKKMWSEGASSLGNSKNKVTKPPFQVIVKTSDWIRAEKGGILDLKVKPGDLIYQGDLVGSILNPFGKTVTQIRAPVTGIIIGVTTAPLTIPGTGIAHVARLKKTLSLVERSMKQTRKEKSKQRKFQK